MSRLTLHIVAIGELLWDEYPQQRYLGGSPTNVIWHGCHLGCRAEVVGRVGADAAGDEWISLMQSMGLSTRYVQRDPERPTGSVQVRVSKNGQPVYGCTQEVAFDHLTFDRSLEELASSADAVYFTTLGQRHPKAAAAIGQFLDAAGKALKVYDLNLTGWNDRIAATVEAGLQRCQVLQVNQNEMAFLHRYFNSHMDDHGLLRYLLQLYDLRLVALTLGDNGCLLMSPQETLAHSGFNVAATDTNGCGDAFCAMMMVKLLAGASLAEIADQSCRLAAWVATRPGAVPDWSVADLAAIAPRSAADDLW
ncbi:MAG TPA: PfkB family carbohydrate kinase [bacterium]|nr:PfkB family carbohydrate kinase [bacterium]HPN34663.1 PfkB family carbohydrate kinase [bacterium]